jgi:hypothetical protein
MMVNARNQKDEINADAIRGMDLFSSHFSKVTGILISVTNRLRNTHARRCGQGKIENHSRCQM